MRTVLAAALCFVLGACATIGTIEPDIAGIYDLVSPAEGVSGWFVLSSDGTWNMEMDAPGQETATTAGVSKFGDWKEGCRWIESWVPDAPDMPKTQISFCDGVMTVPSNDNATFHKRG